MMWQLLTTLVMLQFAMPVHSEGSPPIKALQFGDTLADYITFHPNISQVRDALTVCAWVKKGLLNDVRTWLSYRTDEYWKDILISDGGGYNYFKGSNCRVDEKVSVPLNTWTHQCNTWSTTSRTIRVYYNGTLVGTRTISPRNPLSEGYMVLGHEAGTKHTLEVFGGQLMKLNIFGKEMTAAEVAEMYKGGRCSEVEKKFEEIRFITWESILKKKRFGKVYEVDSECP